eukprot:scaffold126919_cov20-Tisochrysis_lutea.AAC.1
MWADAWCCSCTKPLKPILLTLAVVLTLSESPSYVGGHTEPLQKAAFSSTGSGSFANDRAHQGRPAQVRSIPAGSSTAAATAAAAMHGGNAGGSANAREQEQSGSDGVDSTANGFAQQHSERRQPGDAAAAAVSLMEEHISGVLEQAGARPLVDKVWSAAAMPEGRHLDGSAGVLAKEQCGGTHPEGTPTVAVAAVSLLEKHASDALEQTHAEAPLS